MERNSLIELAKADAKAFVNPSTTFDFDGQKLTNEAISKTFAQELNKLGATTREFEKNKNLIFELLEVALTEVIPAKVLQSYGQFADVQNYEQGTKPVFKVRISEASKKRAKQFVTRVGLAGRYEVFKLDGYSLEVPTSAYGAAARVEWEELLNGTFTMSDYYNLVLEGLDEKVYREIAKALEETVKNIQPANKTSQSTFKEKEMDRLVATADAYGKSAIYCTFEFAATMLPAESFRLSDSMKEQLWNNGAFTTYKGHDVIILPQSFEDVDNAVKVIDPSKAFIIPIGSEKPVKVAFEGSAQVKAFENRDWSQEIETYQKLGVATYLVNPGICVYENTSLTKDNLPA